MHLARNPPALVLLREDHAGEELCPRVLGFGLPALGEVEVGADDTDDGPTGLAPDRVAAGEDLYVVAVPVPQAELAFVRLRTPRDALVHFLRAGERQRQTLLALADRRVGALALGDLAHREDDGRRRRVGLLESRERNLDVGNAAVAADDLRFERPDVLTRCRPLDALPVCRVAIADRVDDEKVGERAPQQLLGVRHAGLACRCLVREYQESALADEDAVGRPLHQASIGFPAHDRSP